MTDGVAPLSAMIDANRPEDEPVLLLFGHDLRAALSDVVGGLRFVDLDSLGSGARLQIERARVSAETLTRLLECGLAEIEGRIGPAEPEYLDLHRFLTDLDLRWSGRALEKGVGFTLHRASDLPSGLLLDRVALDRVLSNLLGNAIKYSGGQPVVCDVKMHGADQLRWTVRDAGPGYPTAILDQNLLLRDRRADALQTGSGLGLFIVADLVHRMGGRLSLHNGPASGAAAQIDLPLTMPSDADWTTIARQSPLLVGKRVLIADDNPTSQTILAGLAKGLGAQVEVVDDGEMALDRLQWGNFDLLVVDVEMPKLSGLDVMRCLRRMPGTIAQIPVIAVTAYGPNAHRKAILAAGANDLMVKPVACPLAFGSVVRRVLASRPQLQPGRASINADAEPGLSLDKTRLTRLLDMAGPDSGRDLLERLISDLSSVKRGLIKAVAQPGLPPDWEAVRGHSHVLISLAGAVGAQALQTGAETLNLLADQLNRQVLSNMIDVILGQLDLLIAHVNRTRSDFAVQSQ